VSRPRLEAVLRHAAGLAAHPEATADAELLRRFAADRDAAAFAALVARHGPMVWAVCRNLLPHDPDAEDAFQATFLALVRGAGQVRAGDRLAGWLHGVAVRVALKARRAAAHRRKREQAAAGAEAGAPVPDGAWEELLAAVHEEVQALPAALRSAFVLCGLEGVRPHDAAARLGCTPGTLTTRLARARQRLLAGLARRGIAPAVAVGAVGLAATTGGAVPVVLTARAADLVRVAGPISPSVLYLAQGVIDMSARSKWLAAALLAAVGLSATVGTAVVSQTPAQPPPAGGRGGGGPAADPAPRGRPATEPAPRGGFGGFAGGVMPTRGWEYKVIHESLYRNEAEADLNKLGADGWELCATGERGALVFKRPRGLPPMGGGGGGIGGVGPMGGSGSGAFGNVPPDATEPRTTGRGTGGATNPFGGPAGRRGGPADRAPVPGSELRVIRLQNAQADELARLLKEVFGGVFGGNQARVAVSADVRSNSLIVNADPDTVKAILALVERLDEPGPKKR
jgi:RNA polymerase sigma factor (sigma-70 family)